MRVRISISTLQNKCVKIYIHWLFLYQRSSIANLNKKSLFSNNPHAPEIMFSFHSFKALRIQTWCPVLCAFAAFAQVKLSDLQMAASGDCPCYPNKREAKQLKINHKAKFSTQNLSSRSSSSFKTYKMQWKVNLAGINLLQRQDVPLNLTVL